MKVCGVIAEFNPFHNGHKYLIDKVKERGYTHIVAVMSGDFVQRGEPAIFSKEIRTKIALKMGINLILKLPTPKVLSTAQKYAFFAVDLMKHLGCVETLSFGIESENIERLNVISDALSDAGFHNRLKYFLSKGITFAKARENALKEIVKSFDIIQEVKHPNNILAIEYLNALKSSNINALAFKRMENPSYYLSASSLRKLIIKKDELYEKYVPPESKKFLDLPFNFSNLERTILFKLRSLSIDQISNLPDITEGLENRIYGAIKKSCSLDELLFNIKTKRYTMSRIKRIILCALLDINSSIANEPFKYLRVLGSDKKGFEILKSAKLPVVTKFSEALKIDSQAKDSFEIENKCTNLYNSLTPNILPCEREKTFKIIKGWEL